MTDLKNCLPFHNQNNFKGYSSFFLNDESIIIILTWIHVLSVFIIFLFLKSLFLSIFLSHSISFSVSLNFFFSPSFLSNIPSLFLLPSLSLLVLILAPAPPPLSLNFTSFDSHFPQQQKTRTLKPKKQKTSPENQVQEKTRTTKNNSNNIIRGHQRYHYRRLLSFWVIITTTIQLPPRSSCICHPESGNCSTIVETREKKREGNEKGEKWRKK